MYFDTTKVNSILICNNCEERLDIPKSLPCGEVICSICASSIQINDNKFTCLLCKNKHEMPIDGLPNSKLLLKLLAIEPTKVSRGKLFDTLERLLDEIQKKRNFIKLGIESSNDLIKEYCIDLRNSVQLTVEEAIQQINDISDKIIEEIDKYEQELIGLNNTNSLLLQNFNKIAKDLESFHHNNTEYLKKHVVDDEMIGKSNEEAKNLIKKAELEIQNLKDIIFDGRLFKFEKNKEKMNKSILGETKVLDKRVIDSLILVNWSQIKDLISLCEFPFGKKWSLIYRASRDGFEANKFHTKCDNKSKTLIIIKSTNGYVFGGYTEKSWNHSGGLFSDAKNDPNSFIFSLINKNQRPIKLKWSQKYAIYCHTMCGPVFGGGSDLSIADQSNVNTDSYSNLGCSFTHPDYAYESNEAKSFLAGSSKFQVSEIEVYSE